MINLEIPKKLKPLIVNARQVGLGMFRPISRTNVPCGVYSNSRVSYARW